MREKVWVARKEVRRRLTQEGWRHAGKKKFTELLRNPKRGRARVSLPESEYLKEDHVRLILQQAGIDRNGIEEFLRNATGKSRRP